MLSDLEFSAVGLRIRASGLEDVLIKLLVSPKPGSLKQLPFFKKSRCQP